MLWLFNLNVINTYSTRIYFLNLYEMSTWGLVIISNRWQVTLQQDHSSHISEVKKNDPLELSSTLMQHAVKNLCYSLSPLQQQSWSSHHLLWWLAMCWWITCFWYHSKWCPMHIEMHAHLSCSWVDRSWEPYEIFFIHPRHCLHASFWTSGEYIGH